MTAREVMDIDEAREKYARGLAISLTDRQIDDQLLNRLRQSLEPHRGPFQYISTIRGRMHVHDYVSAQRGVSLRAIVY
jgi:DNA polymerase-3 subunit alpha